MNLKHSIATSAIGNDQDRFGDLLDKMFTHADAGPGTMLGGLIRQHALDDLEVAQDVIQNNPEQSERLIARARTWLELADEINVRVSEAEAEAQDHEEDDWELYRVPTANDVPRFEHGWLATSKDFGALGYVHRSKVVEAIEIMLRGSDETERRPPVGDISEVLS